MGTKHSRLQDDTSTVQAENPLNKPVLETLKLARQNPIGDLSFEKLLLNFPLLEGGFLKLEEAFNQAIGSAITESALGKTMTCQEMTHARHSLGFQIDEDDFHDLFPRRRDPNLILNFNDMVVVLAIITVHIGSEKAVELGADPQVVKTLMLAVNSFNHFDKDGNGSLAQEEVTGTMEEVDYSAHAKRTAEPGGGAGIKQRWKLMDVDRDGRANLQDYLNSLHNWVIN